MNTPPLLFRGILSGFKVIQYPRNNTNEECSIPLEYDGRPNGACLKGTMNNGKLDGSARIVDENGQTLFELSFTNGSITGPYKQYKDGKLQAEGSFADSLRTGETREYSNGHVVFHGFYSGDKRDGKAEEYDESGFPLYDGCYSSGVRTDLDYHLSYNGIEYKCHYNLVEHRIFRGEFDSSNQFHGKCIEVTEHNDPIQLVRYEHGTLTQVLRLYTKSLMVEYNDGRCVFIGEYAHDPTLYYPRSGVGEEYCNSRLVFSGEYQRDARNGRGIFHCVDDSLFLSREWKEGEATSIGYFLSANRKDIWKGKWTDVKSDVSVEQVDDDYSDGEFTVTFGSTMEDRSDDTCTVGVFEEVVEKDAALIKSAVAQELMSLETSYEIQESSNCEPMNSGAFETDDSSDSCLPVEIHRPQQVISLKGESDSSSCASFVEKGVQPSEEKSTPRSRSDLVSVENTEVKTVEQSAQQKESPIMIGSDGSESDASVLPVERVHVFPQESYAAVGNRTLPVEATVPVDETVAPVDETVAPVDETATPVDETATPVDETVAPVDETVAPVNETVAPVDETVAPVNETVAPVNETVVPVNETVVPVNETLAPVDETLAPVTLPVEATVPVNETATPVNEITVPVTLPVEAPETSTVTPVEVPIPPITASVATSVNVPAISGSQLHQSSTSITPSQSAIRDASQSSTCANSQLPMSLSQLQSSPLPMPAVDPTKCVSVKKYGRYTYKGVFSGEVLNGEGAVFYDDKLLVKGFFKYSKLNGYGQMFYLSTGTLQFQGSFVNDYLNGEGEEFDEGGRLVYKGTYVGGKQEGMGEYYDYQKMQVKKGQFKGGRMNGRGSVRRLQDNELLCEGSFADDVLVEGRRYDPDRHWITEEGSFDQHLFIGMQYRAGRPYLYSSFVDGIPDGMTRQYYSNGMVEKEGCISRGRNEGHFNFYYETGEVWMNIEYENGVERKKRIYYRSGRIQWEGTVNDGFSQGKLFDEMGRCRVRGTFHNNQPMDGQDLLYEKRGSESICFIRRICNGNYDSTMCVYATENPSAFEYDSSWRLVYEGGWTWSAQPQSGRMDGIPVMDKEGVWYLKDGRRISARWSNGTPIIDSCEVDMGTRQGTKLRCSSYIGPIILDISKSFLFPIFGYNGEGMYLFEDHSYFEGRWESNRLVAVKTPILWENGNKKYDTTITTEPLDGNYAHEYMPSGPSTYYSNNGAVYGTFVPELNRFDGEVRFYVNGTWTGPYQVKYRTIDGYNYEYGYSSVCLETDYFV